MPGSEAANREVARGGGCEGCEWTLVLDCDRNLPIEPHCNAAHCPQGSWFRLYLQRPEDQAPRYVDHVCVTATQRIVTPQELAVDVERHLTELAPPATTIAVQPENRALTGMPTFFVAEGPTTDRARLTVTTAAGPASLAIDIAPVTYRWEFGDGATCETTQPGGRYDGIATERCDDRVAHIYGTSGTYDVRLGTTWGGTYTFDVGFGRVGPLPIPGDGVAGPAGQRAVRVREARAELVGG